MRSPTVSKKYKDSLRAGVNHGFVILQMNPVSKSLEDVFLELTEKEGTQKEVLPEKKLHFVKSHFGKESKEDGE